MAHPLLDHFLAAADGTFPEVDGAVTVLPPLDDGLEASVAFTGHAFIATALPAAALTGADGFGGSMSPDVLRLLGGPDGEIGVLDATLVAFGTGLGGPPARDDLAGHPRVAHALGLRRNVEVYGDERGLVTISQGLAGRRELSIEVTDTGRGRGRSLLTDALGLAPSGEPVFAAVSPGNARSLRAFLAVGFTPIGSEVIIRPRRRP
ncbi:hypothetical protein AB0I28_22160 [Phytomonospora sp. NPDC050363]|uniref:hypothetical protein n=1 Tax=Phytomonospora sp. NPDC050363 TaxID=3155642 RepID=UPI0034112C5B